MEQYHAQCTTANILTCVPTCNSTTHGYELLATIDGTDTKFSCALANLLFSWVGAAALGGFLGQNVDAFVSAVISGAAGTYVLLLMENADVGTDLLIQPGQNFIMNGDPGLGEQYATFDAKVLASSNSALSFRNIALTSLIMGPGSTIYCERTRIGYIDYASFGSNGDGFVNVTLVDTILDGTGECHFGECTVQTGNVFPSGASNQVHRGRLSMLRTTVSPQVPTDRTSSTVSPIPTAVLGVSRYGGDSHVEAVSSVFERVHITAFGELQFSQSVFRSVTLEVYKGNSDPAYLIVPGSDVAFDRCEFLGNQGEFLGVYSSELAIRLPSNGAQIYLFGTTFSGYDTSIPACPGATAGSIACGGGVSCQTAPSGGMECA